MMTGRAIWAIARNTIAQALRVKAAFAILVLYLVLVPSLPFLVEGDGTLRGLLHVVIGYSLIAAGILLGIFTLAISTTTLWSEIHEKQIFLLEARPIHRWQVLLGKLLGIMAINITLLAFMAVVTWGCVRYLTGRYRVVSAARVPWIAVKETKWGGTQRALAQQQVLVARRVVRPDPPEMEEDVEHFYGILEKQGKLPEGKTKDEIKKEIREEILTAINAVGPREVRYWRFGGLKRARRPGVNITLRFKFSSSVYGSEAPAQTLWVAGDVQGGQYVRYIGAYKPDEVHEQQLRADIISPDGTLDLRVQNIDPKNLTLVFTGPDAIEVLVPVAGFAANLARGLWLIFIEVLFLAILGLFCSTFMSFPVSPVVALCLLLLIYLAGSVKAEFEAGLSFGDKKQQSAWDKAREYAVRGLAEAVRFVLPPFDKYSSSEQVSSGVEVSWWTVFEATATVAVIRGGLLVLLGALIFERRELAGAVR